MGGWPKRHNHGGLSCFGECYQQGRTIGWPEHMPNGSPEDSNKGSGSSETSGSGSTGTGGFDSQNKGGPRFDSREY